MSEVWIYVFTYIVIRMYLCSLYVNFVQNLCLHPFQEFTSVSGLTLVFCWVQLYSTVFIVRIAFIMENQWRNTMEEWRKDSRVGTVIVYTEFLQISSSKSFVCCFLFENDFDVERTMLFWNELHLKDALTSHGTLINIA